MVLRRKGVTNHWTEVDWTGLDWTLENVRNKLIMNATYKTSSGLVPGRGYKTSS